MRTRTARSTARLFASACAAAACAAPSHAQTTGNIAPQTNEQLGGQFSDSPADRASAQRDTDLRGRATPDLLATDDARLSVRLSTRPEVRFGADFENGNGSYSRSAVPIEINFTYAATDTLRLSLGVEGELAHYDLDNTTLVAGDPSPFDDVASVNFSLGAVWQLRERWSLVLTGYVGSSWADGAEFSDGVTWGGIVGVTHSFNERLTLGGGVGIGTRIEDDVLVFPFIFVRWQIDDRWSLETAGQGLRLNYTLNEDLTLYATGGFDRNEFRLDDTGSLPDGIVRDRAVLVGAGLQYTPADLRGLSVGLEAGAVVYQEFEVLNASGDEVSEQETDPGAYLGVVVQYRF